MKLKVGESYLHRNLLFIRTIERIDGQDVFYHDQVAGGRCTKAVFTKQCLRIATAEDQEAWQRSRGNANEKPLKSKAEIEFEELCRDAKKRDITFISIENTRQLGESFEEVTRCLKVLQNFRLYLRIL